VYAAGDWQVEFIDCEHVRPKENQCVSYLDTNVQVLCTFLGGDAMHIACDAERSDRIPREPLVRRYGFTNDCVGFAKQWTVAEVGAKLALTSIVRWLQNPISDQTNVVNTFEFPAEHAVVSVGLRAARGPN
jgi:hypothetical protein